LKDTKNQAAQYYHLAIEEIFNGLNVKLENDDRAMVEYGLNIQEKLKSDLMMALERVENLSILKCIFQIILFLVFIKKLFRDNKIQRFC
jgi:hypothetical protein